MGEKIYVADKETLDKVYNILAPEQVYGFIEHNDILAPGSRIEYIGANKNYTPFAVNLSTGVPNYGSWKDFFFLKGNKPYMVKSDGTPDYRLDENDYTKREDGTASDVANLEYDGGAFAWLPKIYKHEHMEGDDRVVMFSPVPRDGYEAVGFFDPNDKELEGVWLPMFYGAIYQDKMRSISGTQPDYNKATAAQKTAIDAFSARAAFFGGSIWGTLTDIMIMLAKTTELQGAFGYGNRNGYDATLTPTMGVKQNQVIGGGQFYGTNDGHSLNKAFHSLVPITQNQWMRDPYTIMVNGRIKVSPHYKYSLTADGYTDTGITLPKQYKADESQNTGTFYPHKYQSVPGFGALPVYPYRGSTSTGGCDGLWQNCDITAVALRFGACSNGATGGPRYLDLDDTATSAYWRFGSAVLLFPPEGVAA